MSVRYSFLMSSCCSSKNNQKRNLLKFCLFKHRHFQINASPMLIGVQFFLLLLVTTKATIFFLDLLSRTVSNRKKVKKKNLVFCYQNCSYLLWEKIVLVIENFFWNSRLKAANLQNFWDRYNNFFKRWKVRTIFGNRMLF